MQAPIKLNYGLQVTELVSFGGGLQSDVILNLYALNS